MERDYQPFLINMPVTEANDMLKRIKPAVAARSGQLPVLSGVLIETFPNNRVRFTASDVDFTLRLTAEAQVRIGTPTVVPFRTFKKIVDTAKKGELSIEGVDTQNVAIGAGRTVVKTPGWGYDQWPVIPSLGDEPSTATINFDALSTVFPAVSTDDNRPILTSVEVTEYTYAATDSYRLYVTHTVENTGLVSPLLLPRVFAKEAVKMGGIHTVQYNKKHVFFSANGFEMIARTVAGEFPRWAPLIPNDPPVLFAFDSHPEFVATLKELRAMATTVNSDSPLRIARDDTFPNRVILSIGNVDYGMVEASLKGDLPLVSPIAFNPQYMAELLDGFETTTLYGSDGLKPTVGVVEDDGIKRQRLLMPVRIS